MCLLAVPRAAVGLTPQAHCNVTQRFGEPQCLHFTERRYIERTEVVCKAAAVELVERHFDYRLAVLPLVLPDGRSPVWSGEWPSESCSRLGRYVALGESKTHFKVIN